MWEMQFIIINNNGQNVLDQYSRLYLLYLLPFGYSNTWLSVHIFLAPLKLPYVTNLLLSQTLTFGGWFPLDRVLVLAQSSFHVLEASTNRRIYSE